MNTTFVFHLEHVFLPKSWYENWPFFNFYLVAKNTKVTISVKDTAEILFSAHFLMPLGIPFHEYMVSNRSIFFSDTPCMCNAIILAKYDKFQNDYY